MLECTIRSYENEIEKIKDSIRQKGFELKNEFKTFKDNRNAEIDGLCKVLKLMEKEVEREEKDKDRRIKELEKIVDEYKQIIDELKNKEDKNPRKEEVLELYNSGRLLGRPHSVTKDKKK